MSAKYETDLYRRIHAELKKVAIVDCHEHLLPEAEYPTGTDITLGRFFQHYANWDLCSAGLSVSDMTDKLQNPKSGLSTSQRQTLRKRFAGAGSWN